MTIFAISHSENRAITDLNRDDIENIAYGSVARVNDGSGQFAEAGIIFAVGSFDCAFDDFDGDGDNESACPRALPAAEVHISLNNGDETFSNGQVFATEASPRAIRATNVNGDSHVDLVRFLRTSPEFSFQVREM